jgi:dTDP-4-amino-4,6-dideoxygalactose transaminase
MLARVRSNLTLDDLWLAAGHTEFDAADRLEHAFATHFGFPHALYFPSARSALRALLGSLGWRSAEVLSPAYICAEVPYAVTLSGNQVGLVDSAADHFLPGPAQWHTAATSSSKMAIFTPLFGYPLDPDCRKAVRDKAPSAFILFDEAQSYGVEDHQGLQLREADGAIFSLGLGKLATSITGGVILLRDSNLHLAVARYRKAHFAEPSTSRIVRLLIKALTAWIAFREPALSVVDIIERKLGAMALEVSDSPAELERADSAREILPSAFQARIGLRQLTKLRNTVADRRRIGRYYDDRLRREGLRTFSYAATPTWPRYPFAVADRDAAIAAFRSDHIQISRFLPYSCAELPPYRAENPTCSNASLWARSMINLPNWQGVSLTQADRVINALLRLRDRNPGHLIVWPSHSQL